MIIKYSFLLTLLFLLSGFGTCIAQPPNRLSDTVSIPGSRSKISLNGDWKFSLENAMGSERIGLNDKSWTSVTLPHTWNAQDAFDDEPGYRQGNGWYRRNLEIDDKLRGKQLFVKFEGANQIAEVFVNGNLVGRHVGGYTAFCFDITDFVDFSRAKNTNLLAVRVNNSPASEIPPSSTADFNFYGGIYRDVFLISTDPVHLAVNDYASTGVYIDTPLVSEEKASVRIRGKVANDLREKRKVKIKNTLFDAKNIKIAESESVVEIEPKKEADFEQTILEIKKPALWSPDSPNLYRVRTELYDGDRLIDTVENPLGFRWFSFDVEKGFFLNGKPLKLIGANRHQDYQGLGNAMPDELSVRDLEIIKNQGMNWVLLAHYPHDPSVLDAADRLGLIVWEELPILRQIGTSPSYAEISKQMLIEMIRQNYNHPSVVFWCYMNEIFLRMRSEAGYTKQVVDLAKELEEIARREDPNRLTAISMNRPYTKNDPYEESGLTSIPQVLGWHLYFGWYYGKPEEIGGFLDDYHKRYPNRKILVSEYGADSDSRIHSMTPTIKDYSTEWAQLFHESAVEQMMKREYLGGFGVWNAFDFGSESRVDSTPHINKKGIFTFDRKPKDVAFYYQARFLSKPILHIAAREWNKRRGKQNETTQIKVYTNLTEVELFLNGKSVGKKKIDSTRIGVWNFPLKQGINKIEASGIAGTQSIKDETEIQFSETTTILKSTSEKFTELAIDTGASIEFIDSAGVVWESDQPYTPNGWGYLDDLGASNSRADQNILGTVDDPLYQTYREGLKGYRFDVPSGEYEIDLRFAEPLNLRSGRRVFSVSVNGKLVITDLDLAREAKSFNPVVKKFKAFSAAKDGLTITFAPINGKPVLSGIKVRRIS